MNKVFLVLAIFWLCLGCSKEEALPQPYSCPDMSWLFEVNTNEVSIDGLDNLEHEYIHRELSDRDVSAIDSAKLKFCIGRAFLHMGHDALAEEYLSRSIGVRDEIPGVRLERAVARLELGNCEGALDDIESERIIGYGFPGLPLLSARANLECENFSEALQGFREFKRESSNGYLAAEELVLEGRILSALGRYSDSIRSYYKALERYTDMHQCSPREVCINPFASRLVNEIIDVQCKAGKPQEATKIYREFANYQKPSVDRPWCAAGSGPNS